MEDWLGPALLGVGLIAVLGIVILRRAALARALRDAAVEVRAVRVLPPAREVIPTLKEPSRVVEVEFAVRPRGHRAWMPAHLFAVPASRAGTLLEEIFEHVPEIVSGGPGPLRGREMQRQLRSLVVAGEATLRLSAIVPNRVKSIALVYWDRILVADIPAPTDHYSVLEPDASGRLEPARRASEDEDAWPVGHPSALPRTGARAEPAVEWEFRERR